MWPPPFFLSAGCQGNHSSHRGYTLFLGRFILSGVFNIFLLVHLSGLTTLCAFGCSPLVMLTEKKNSSPNPQLPSYFFPPVIANYLDKYSVSAPDHLLSPQSLILSCSDTSWLQNVPAFLSNLPLWPSCCIWFCFLFFFWAPQITTTNLPSVLSWWCSVPSAPSPIPFNDNLHPSSSSRPPFTPCLHSKQVALLPKWLRKLQPAWPPSATSCSRLYLRAHHLCSLASVPEDSCACFCQRPELPQAFGFPTSNSSLPSLLVSFLNL